MAEGTSEGRLTALQGQGFEFKFKKRNALLNLNNLIMKIIKISVCSSVAIVLALACVRHGFNAQHYRNKTKLSS
jgi:hypothetical protein